VTTAVTVVFASGTDADGELVFASGAGDVYRAVAP
jgi:hypothetical protein